MNKRQQARLRARRIRLLPRRHPRNYVSYDGLRCELMAINIERDPRCAICSENGVLGLGDLEPLPVLGVRRQFNVPEVPVDAPDASIELQEVRIARSEIAGYLTYMPRK